MTRIESGNRKFIQDRSDSLSSQMSNPQKPLIAVLTCSDARIDPATVCGLDRCEVFSVRVAGNSISAGKGVMESIEYAVEHLGIRTILVLGHSDCGAAKAAVCATARRGYDSMLEDMRISRENLRSDDCDSADRVAERNVARQMKSLSGGDGIIGSKAQRGELTVFGAFLDLRTGKIRFVE